VKSERPKRRKPRPLKVTSNFSRAKFIEAVNKSKEYVRAGDIFQVAISQRFAAKTDADPFEIYRSLRVVNPSPYMYFLKLNDLSVVGSSPEMLVKVQGREAFYRPIAGTRPRGADEKEDAALEAELAADPKEQAEHIMLVDLCRNDIGRVTRPSTQPVDRLMAVESFSHVFHLVSSVSGRLQDGVDTWQAVRATFPAGTMTGAPKVRAMEIIDGLEEQRRGSYAGAVGLVDVRGWSELALCIRTIEYDGSTYSTQSSAGMVAQSEPAAEWRETLAKMGAAYWALTGEELLP
jgi:anthranilate synthase component I